MAPVDTDVFTVKLYDAQSGFGNVLSSGSTTQQIAAGSPNAVNVTFNPVVASVSLILSNPSPAQGTPQTITLSVNARDAAGNTIVGPGVFINASGAATPISLSDSDGSGATTLSTASVPDPSTAVSVQYNGQPVQNVLFFPTVAGLPSNVFKGASLSSRNDFWTTRATMATPRFSLAAGAIGNVLYAVGGYNASYGGYVNVVEAYDPVSNSWTGKAPMLAPTGQINGGVSVVNGTLYVIGGFNATVGLQNPVEAYDSATNSWATKASPPTPRTDLATSAVNGIIYAIGGASNVQLNTVEAYDPATNTWAVKASMPTAREGVETSVVSGIIYAMGGIQGNGVALNVVEAYDPSSDTWTTKAPMPTARYQFGAVAVNGKIYAIGGAGNSCGPCNTVEAYDPATNSWSTKAPMPTARSVLAAAVISGTVFAVGGTAFGQAVNTVEAYVP